MANALWSIIWFVIFIVIGWWIGNFCAGWFVLISPCWVCFDALTPVVSFELDKFILLELVLNKTYLANLTLIISHHDST